MNLKKITLMAMLIVLFMGIVSASEVSDDTYNADTNGEVIPDTQYDTYCMGDDTIEHSTENEKLMKKDKTIKAKSTTYGINDFNTLKSLLTSGTHDNLTLDIKSNISLMDDTEVNEAIKTIYINGNNKTIRGNNHCFLSINHNCSLYLNNITITNCYDDEGSVLTKKGGYLKINNSLFYNNRAYEDGGTLYIDTEIYTTYWYDDDTSFYDAYTEFEDIETTVEIYNSKFINNEATNGGAIFTRGNLTIANTEFINNTASEFAGAIYNIQNNNNILKCNFTNNIAQYNGGAIHNIYNNLSISNSNFKNNSLDLNQKGGGAIHTYKSTTTINKSNFTYNNATKGGAIHTEGSNTILKENNFINNTAYEGAGVYMTYAIESENTDYEDEIITMTDTTSYIQRNNFTDNKAWYGGAIYNTENNVTIEDNIFSSNTARHDGGAIFNEGEKYYSYYGSIISTNSYNQIHNYSIGYNITIQFNNFIKNHAENGSAIYLINPSIDENNSKEYLQDIHDNGHLIEYKYDKNTQALIMKNTFKQNTAENTDEAIINHMGTLSMNIFSNISPYNSTIYNYANTTIINNIFNDGIMYTFTMLKSAKSVIGEKLTLTANVVDGYGRKVNEGNLIFKLNGVTIKDNGKLTGSSNPLKVKVVNGLATAVIIPDLDMRNANKLTAHYIGTNNYNASASRIAKIQISQRNASIIVSSNVKTIKQGQVLTITAKVYDTTNGKRSTNLTAYNNQFVYFKVNGITLKDSKGNMLKIKVVNGMATTKYTIPLGLSGVTDGKSMTPKNHTILAGFYNKNYQENLRNTSYFQVERSNITITISNATVNNKTHKLSLTATIRDYLGNIVKGPNKCVIKVNGISLKNGTEAMYYYSTDGILNIKNIDIASYSNYKTIEIVTQDRLAYKSQRNTTKVIKITN
ncbi:MAG: hypothetical protein IJJ47_11505 [Methanosphaera sp.]|nr:hypothetical protein [Methanosphaera sp.]